MLTDLARIHRQGRFKISMKGRDPPTSRNQLQLTSCSELVCAVFHYDKDKRLCLLLLLVQVDDVCAVKNKFHCDPDVT